MDTIFNYLYLVVRWVLWARWCCSRGSGVASDWVLYCLVCVVSILFRLVLLCSTYVYLHTHTHTHTHMDTFRSFVRSFVRSFLFYLYFIVAFFKTLLRLPTPPFPPFPPLPPFPHKTLTSSPRYLVLHPFTSFSNCPPHLLGPHHPYTLPPYLPPFPSPLNNEKPLNAVTFSTPDPRPFVPYSFPLLLLLFFVYI